MGETTAGDGAPRPLLPPGLLPNECLGTYIGSADDSGGGEGAGTAGAASDWKLPKVNEPPHTSTHHYIPKVSYTHQYKGSYMQH